MRKNTIAAIPNPAAPFADVGEGSAFAFVRSQVVPA
jgi:hypothetical protein